MGSGWLLPLSLWMPPPARRGLEWGRGISTAPRAGPPLPLSEGSHHQPTNPLQTALRQANSCFRSHLLWGQGRGSWGSSAATAADGISRSQCADRGQVGCWGGEVLGQRARRIQAVLRRVGGGALAPGAKGSPGASPAAGPPAHPQGALPGSDPGPRRGGGGAGQPQPRDPRSPPGSAPTSTCRRAE